MILFRPVTPRASRNTDMVASVPELTKRTCSTGIRSMISAQDQLLPALARRMSSAPGGVGDRADYVGMGMAQQHRTPGADQVNQLVAVDVIQVRAAGMIDEAWRPAHRSERANR